jgi:hypothetical protein
MKGASIALGVKFGSALTMTKIGALFGTFTSPGIGTVVFGGIGAILGSVGAGSE